MGDTPEFPAPLSRRWAFVVQLRQGSGFTSDSMVGRVEHIASGHATTFGALTELLQFMEQTMAAQSNAEDDD